MRARVSVVSCAIPSLLIALAGSARALGDDPFPAAIEVSSLDGTTGFGCEGAHDFDLSGDPVSSAGDVNGDGIDDFVIGAIRASPGGRTYAGQSYVVFGGAGVGASGSIDLAALDGTDGFVINGVGADDNSGYAVSGAGDVNGDGVDDLIIGAWGADPGGRSQAGTSYVVYGRIVSVQGPFAPAVELASLNGTNGFAINGIDAGDRSGWSVGAAGDINGDGVGDVAIGAINGDPHGTDSGETYVVFGGAGVGASGSINLSALNGTSGFVINGIAAGDKSGYSVSPGGDVNGDGTSDLVIGAYHASPGGRSQAGTSYVVYGKKVSVVGPFGPSINLSSLTGVNGFAINGIDAGDVSGWSVGAGDINGDGIDDVIIGGYRANPNGVNSAGESYVVFGKNTSVAGVFGPAVELASLHGATGFVINGINAYDDSGFSVSCAGDVNGDGADDVVIGARFASPDGVAFGGESYVVFGGAAVGASGSVELASLDGATGFRVEGSDAFGSSGSSVAGAGDINGDGVDDILVGAPGVSPQGRLYAGETYVVLGRAGAAPACIGDVNGDGQTNISDFNILASHFGASVTPNTNGDLTGDGIVNVADFNVLAGDFGCGV